MEIILKGFCKKSVTIELIHYKVYGADEKNKVSGNSNLCLLHNSNLKPTLSPVESWVHSKSKLLSEVMFLIFTKLYREHCYLTRICCVIKIFYIILACTKFFIFIVVYTFLSCIAVLKITSKDTTKDTTL